MLEERDIDCPYCGENLTVSIDCSAGSHDFIEDCIVCCRPIELHADIDAGQLLGLKARRDDE
ncbi:MAG: CPXCG motif-containing cysteine-rich protein [Gammaproteobacteria bacterium]|nr:CPXCG motif-containing cysteine-rich protein [Gammaproteobacteria bacterium]